MISLMLTLLVSSAAPGTPKVVSPEWNTVDVKKELTTFFADTLAIELRTYGIEVITSQDIATLLGMERQKALLGCNEEAGSCITELANALGADATLQVNLVRFGSGAFQGSAKIISSLNGATLSTAVLDSPSEDKLKGKLKRVASLLAVPWGATPLKEDAEIIADFMGYSWVPLSLGVALGGAGAGMLLAADSDYRTMATEETRPEEKARRGAALQTAGWVAAGVGAGMVVAGIVMAAWPDAPVTPSVSITPAGSAVGVGGRF